MNYEFSLLPSNAVFLYLMLAEIFADGYSSPMIQYLAISEAGTISAITTIAGTLVAAIAYLLPRINQLRNSLSDLRTELELWKRLFTEKHEANAVVIASTKAAADSNKQSINSLEATTAATALAVPSVETIKAALSSVIPQLVQQPATEATLKQIEQAVTPPSFSQK